MKISVETLVSVLFGSCGDVVELVVFIISDVSVFVVEFVVNIVLGPAVVRIIAAVKKSKLI